MCKIFGPKIRSCIFFLTNFQSGHTYDTLKTTHTRHKHIEHNKNETRSTTHYYYLTVHNYIRQSSISEHSTATDKAQHKHCQRHNGLEGWVFLTKVTSLGHITSSWIFHKSWSNFIFRISTKHQLQNLNQASAFRLNLTSKSSESRLRFNFITSTKN